MARLSAAAALLSLAAAAASRPSTRPKGSAAGGICSRLVVEAARHAADRYRAERLVITADPTYHALGLYESLGFKRRELVSGVCRRPH
jgi:hypothetical protein